MKQTGRISLPEIIIVVVVVAVGASIVAGQLGISFAKPQGQAARPAAAQGAAGTAPAQGASASGARPQGGASAQGGAPASGGRPSGTAQGATAAQGSAAGQGGRPQSGQSGQGAPTGQPGQPGQSGQNGRRAFPVRAAAVATGNVIQYTKLHGDVVSSSETKVYPAVAGKLIERKVRVGDRVAKGTVIAYVDPSRAGVNYLPNAVESPVAGTVLSVAVDEGDTITTGTVVALVGNLARVKVAIAVPERYLANLAIGTRAEVRFDAVPGVMYGARIAEMSPVVDPASRTLEVKLDFDRQDPRVLAGMLGTVRLVTDARYGVVVAPRAAVALGTDESSVFVVKPDGTAERRVVILGMEGEESFEVRRGLAAGERLVVEGRGALSDGDRVRVIEDASGTGGGKSGTGGRK